eukprot:TRINITY_DN23729_c0_g1_i1.p3 TRINITY_DN23729_c0_g1~~TRINITY_DN23729_c0_g1_i1.p3  ORF type:complete len:124 (-),score=27.24 TRINITY_DN23729_c0_g1_i1:523-894(-)
MAAVTASACSVAVAVVASSTPRVQQRKLKVPSVAPVGGFNGLRVSSSTGSPLCAEASVDQKFAALVAQCRPRSAQSGGGALSSTMDIGSEIFGIVPVIGACILVGIAIGFALIRVETAVEESE